MPARRRPLLRFTISPALEKFGPIRQAYLAKVDGFAADLPRHIATFTAIFPDYRPQVETWFLHSLGEMDGGTREFNGHHYLMFGADMMRCLPHATIRACGNRCGAKVWPPTFPR